MSVSELAGDSPIDTELHACQPSLCSSPGPEVGWYRMNIQVKRVENAKIAVIGAKMDLINRKNR